MEGKLTKLDLGPGVWVLEADKEYVLIGEIPENLLGQQVRVTGQEVESMGLAMVGKASYEVQTIEAA